MSPHGLFRSCSSAPNPTRSVAGAPGCGWVGWRGPARGRAMRAWLLTTTEFLSLSSGERVLAKVHRIRWIRCTLSTPSLVRPRQVGRSDRLDMDEVGLGVALGSWSGRWVGVWVGVEYFVPSIWCVPSVRILPSPTLTRRLRTGWRPMSPVHTYLGRGGGGGCGGTVDGGGLSGGGPPHPHIHTGGSWYKRSRGASIRRSASSAGADIAKAQLHPGLAGQHKA